MNRKHGSVAIISFAIAMGAVFAHAAIPGVVVTAARRYSADDIRWKPGSRAFALRAGNQTIEVSASDVISVNVATPPELQKAVAQVQSGRPAPAIPVLERIQDDYVMLGPDAIAGQYLTQAYLDMNQPEKAVAAAEGLLRRSPNAEQNAGLMSAYLDALFEAGMVSKADSILGKIIATGNRDAAAFAQVKRGDIEMQRGNLREALISGYLRTIVLFQNVKAVQPEALYKAIECHTALNEHHYAEKWRKRLMAAYPTSEYAKKLSTN